MIDSVTASSSAIMQTKEPLASDSPRSQFSEIESLAGS
jgi:hypothetical protein